MSKSTVIITSHNYGNYIEWAIYSALLQTTPPMEIIVVDDGSTDDTPERVANYCSRVDYLRVEFCNAQSARNAGLQHSSGEYVIFLDADDYLVPNAIEEMERALNQDSALKLVYGDRFVFGDEKSIANMGQGYYWEARTFSIEALQFQNFIDISALIRRSDFAGFDERIRRLQDWDAWLGYLRRDEDAIRLPKPMLHYRVHGQNLTFNRNELIERLKILVKHGVWVLEHPTDVEVSARRRNRSKSVLIAHSEAARDVQRLWGVLRETGFRGTALCVVPGVEEGFRNHTGSTIHIQGASLVQVQACDVEDVLRQRAGALNDPDVERLCIFGKLDDVRRVNGGLRERSAPCANTPLSLAQLMETQRLEDIDALMLNRMAARHLLYMSEDGTQGAFGKAAFRARAWMNRNVTWRLRGQKVAP